MKRKLSIFLLAAMLLTLTACSSDAVLPPVRIGEGFRSPMLLREYSVTEAFQESEAVVRVRVGNWLEESERFHTTFYEATVLKCYKGDIPTHFTLLQSGTSASTYEDYPLFTYGNELLLFLYEYDTDDLEDWTVEYDDLYRLEGVFTTIMYVACADDGTRYYLDRFGLMSMEEQGDPDSTLTVLPASRALGEAKLEELSDNVRQTDSLLAESLLAEDERNNSFTTYAYTEEALETLFTSLNNG